MFPHSCHAAGHALTRSCHTRSTHHPSQGPPHMECGTHHTHCLTRQCHHRHLQQGVLKPSASKHEAPTQSWHCHLQTHFHCKKFCCYGCWCLQLAGQGGAEQWPADTPRRATHTTCAHTTQRQGGSPLRATPWATASARSCSARRALSS
jgi:hypothetical protein